MSDNPYLERNQAVLWARDILVRSNECLIVAGSTNGDGSVDQDGQIVVTDLTGNLLLGLTVSTVLTDSTAFVQIIEKKQLLLASVPRAVVRIIESSDNVTFDAVDQYRNFTQDKSAPLASNLTAKELANWLQDSINAMAATSLRLDQADTGAGKWTSAQFRPNPTMLQKFKSLLKG